MRPLTPQQSRRVGAASLFATVCGVAAIGAGYTGVAGALLLVGFGLVLWRIADEI